MNTKRFLDKVVVVTGGNSGIGRAAALAFGREGAKVVIAARRENKGAEVVKAIQSEGGEAAFVKTDVTVVRDIENLFRWIEERYDKLDCAFNSAAVWPSVKYTADISYDEWNTVIDTNVKGTWLCMKYEIPLMLKAGGGAIVNCSAVHGLDSDKGLGLYSAGMHGVLGLMKAGCIEFGRKNIRVNAVCPGFTKTPMADKLFKQNHGMKRKTLASIPLKRLAEPEEIAGCVLWLCSGDASYVTGQSIVIGGGQGIRP